MSETHPTHPREPRRAETPGRASGLTARSPGAPGNNPRPNNNQVYSSPPPFSLFYFPFSFLLFLFSTVFPLCLALACLCWLLPWLYHVLGGGVCPPFTHNTGRGTSSLSSSQAGSPPACGPSCASAWRRGWGSIPCRWCIGRVRHHCVFSGA